MSYISLQDVTAEKNRQQNSYGWKDEKQQAIMILVCRDVIEIVSYKMS